MAAFAFCGALAAALAYSLWLRTDRMRQEAQVAPKGSPLSQAIQELIAVAGGIYLSLVMLASFLKLTLPDKVEIGALAFDPLALAAVGCAALQPVATTLLKKVK